MNNRLGVVAALAAAVILIATVMAAPTAYAVSSGWAKTYGTTAIDDVFRGIVPSIEGDGFIVAGSTAISGNNDVTIMKIDLDGNVVWNYRYGGSANDLARGLAATSDGYLAVGASNSQGAGKHDFLAIKVDTDGNVVWQKTYGTNQQEHSHNVVATSDGGFVIVGYTGNGAKDALAVKINSTGGLVWKKTYSAGSADEVFRAVAELSDGTVMLAGFTKSTEPAADWYVLRVNGTTGVPIWVNTYGAAGFEEPAVIMELPLTGDVLIMEESKSFDDTVSAWAMRINPADGSINMQKTYGGPNFDELSGAVLVDGGASLLVTGESRINSTVTEDYVVAKLDAVTLELIWAFRHGGDNVDEAEDMALGADGLVAIVGHSKSSFGAGNDDLWIIKVNPATGLIDATCEGLIAHNTLLPWTFHDTNDTAVAVATTTNGNGITTTATTLARNPYTLTVNTQCEPIPPNNPPSALDDYYTIDQDTLLNVTAPGVLGNDTDIDLDPITAVLAGNVNNGNLTLNSDGSFLYSPNTGFNGTDFFTYRADDGEDQSELATVTITVNEVVISPFNNPPVAPGSYFTEVNATLNVNSTSGVLADDSDPDSDPLTAELLTTTANGNLTLNADGSFTYVPDSAFQGVDIFVYRAFDGEDYSMASAVAITVG